MPWFVVLLRALTAGVALAQQSTGEERILSAEVRPAGITFQVPSGGYTKKSHFGLETWSFHPLTVRLVRLRPDYCQGAHPKGLSIAYSYSELGVKMTPKDLKNVVIVNLRSLGRRIPRDDLPVALAAARREPPLDAALVFGAAVLAELQLGLDRLGRELEADDGGRELARPAQVVRQPVAPGPLPRPLEALGHPGEQAGERRRVLHQPDAAPGVDDGVVPSRYVVDLIPSRGDVRMRPLKHRQR